MELFNLTLNGALMDWNGEERRKEHMGLLPECKQMFLNIDQKLDSLLKHDEKINGRYEKHIDEGVFYRNRIERHDEKMKLLTWLFGLLTLPVIFLLIKVVFK